MARADLAPEDRDRPLELDAFVECPECDLLQDVIFVAPDGITEMEELTEAPSTEIRCAGCGHVWRAEYEGWQAHEDAG